MKKLSLKGYITALAFLLVIFNFVIQEYDFFPVIRTAFSPVVIGFVIAYLLDPLVRYFQKVSKGKIKRGLSILLTVLVVLGLVTIFGAVLVPSIYNSAADIVVKIDTFVKEDFDISAIERLLNRIDSDLFSEVVTYINNSLQEILVKVGELSTVLIEGVMVTITAASSGVIKFFMAFIIGLYMLADKADLLSRVKRMNYAFLDKESADTTLRITHKANEIFSSFFVGKIIDSAIVGVLCFALMWLFKIPNAPAIGFIIGVTNIIPYFGPFIGAVPAILVTLASGSFVQAFIVIVLIVCIQQFDGLWLGPKILGDKVGVGAFWIIVSVSVGGALFGLVGMFVGVPVVVLIKTIIEEFVENQLDEKKIEF